MVINRKTIKRLIYIHIYLILFSGLFNSMLPLSSIHSRILDVCTFIEFTFTMKIIKKEIRNINIKWPLVIVGILMCFSVVVSLIRLYSPIIFIRGFYNFFKYFAFFVSCSVILEIEDVKKILNQFNILLVVNALVCSVQYFLLGYKGDYCCGLFGSTLVNSYLNVYICIVSMYAVVMYLNKEITLTKLAISVLLSMYISGLSELKFFYFELISIFALAILYKRPNRKTVMLIFIGIAALSVLPVIIEHLWTSSSASSLSLNGMIKYITDASGRSYGYASLNDLGRIGGISRVNSLFFDGKTNWLGYGIGYCDYGTPFFARYENLHYTWFTYLINYLELGMIGLVLMIAFLVSVALSCFGSKFKKKPECEPYYSMVFIVAILSIVLLYYNTTMRNIPAYLVFFVLSILGVLNKRNCQLA